MRVVEALDLRKMVVQKGLRTLHLTWRSYEAPRLRPPRPPPSPRRRVSSRKPSKKRKRGSSPDLVVHPPSDDEVINISDSEDEALLPHDGLPLRNLLVVFIDVSPFSLQLSLSKPSHAARNEDRYSLQSFHQ